MPSARFFTIIALSALLTIAALMACADREDAVRARIRQGVDKIMIVDTHEHLGPENMRNKWVMSLFTHLHYALSDMWADGMNRSVADSVFNAPGASLADKWNFIAPYWNNTRNTAYNKVLTEAFRDLYGIEDVTENTYEELSRRIQQANKPGWYRTVLREKAGIELMITDTGLRGVKMDREMFRAVLRLDPFLLIWPGEEGIGWVEDQWGVKINTLADWEYALEVAMDSMVAMGFVGVKSAMAYARTLAVNEYPREQVEEVFDRLLAEPGLSDRLSWREKRPLQDWMFDKIAKGCAKRDLAFQIHTGFFYDTGRDVAQANPTNLAPFVIRNPDTRFVLMHSGYPYGRNLLAMAKNLPNVVPDMCWIYVISPSFAAEFLDEAIETLPADKLLGFGGDYAMPEGSYGHAKLCRRIVSKVLADKVLDGYWSETEALAYARKILRENPIKVFRLKLE